MKPISSTTHSRIVVLLRSGQTIRAVAAQTGVSRSTVARVANTVCPDRSSGRPRLLGVRDERCIVKGIMTGEASTAVQAQQQL